MIKKSVLIVVLVAVSGFLSVPLSFHVMQYARGAIFEEHFSISNSTSLNWAGYVIPSASGSVHNVSASWIIPTVDTGGNSYVAFWVGIDGYNDNTVEQTGILAEPSGHGPHSTTLYEVWYEFYPAAPVYATFTASAGDYVYANVSYSSQGFTTYIAVYTGQSTGSLVGTLSHTQTVSGAQDDSAEWIVEAPSSASGILPLADFGNVTFGSGYTGIKNTNYATISGAYGPMGSFSTIVSLTMVSSNGTPEASPSSIIDGGTSFSVIYDLSAPSHGHSH